jgi:hypothetical protein
MRLIKTRQDQIKQLEHKDKRLAQLEEMKSESDLQQKK